MKKIVKLKLQNFKRFTTLEIDFDPEVNILIGDNESGKSTILSAINLVLSGSRSKVEGLGLESLFNSAIVANFLASDKAYEKLPHLFVEIYLNDQNNPDINGKNNSERRVCDGLRLECIPNEELGREIREVLQQEEPSFPYEFYNINFYTFSGEAYTGYRKFVRHLLIDNSQVSSEYAVREYVRDMYDSYASPVEKSVFQNGYNKHKDSFKATVLKSLNEKLEDYEFAIRNNSKSNLETDINLVEDGISIDNKGMGRQCFVKTDFALNRKENNLDVVLLEEPENHLSHGNMTLLIDKIAASKEKQLFISTHSNMVSTRLNLRRTILLNSQSVNPIKLDGIPEATGKFFMKAPDNNILDYILSNRVILVEGDAEYLLFEALYKNTTGVDLAASGIHVLSVGGVKFKRYLDIARHLKIKTAVVRDNDGDYQANCVDRYADYLETNVKIFSDKNNERRTFEVCIYEDNKALCDEVFNASTRTLSVQDYMLKNKAEAAFALLDNKASELTVPSYIQDAIAWINA